MILTKLLIGVLNGTRFTGVGNQRHIRYRNSVGWVTKDGIELAGAKRKRLENCKR